MLAPGVHVTAGGRIGFIVASPLIKEIGACRPARGLVGVEEDGEPVLNSFLTCPVLPGLGR